VRESDVPLRRESENDFRVPLNQTLEDWSVLQRQRIPSRLIVWPEENHWITKGEDSRYWYQEVYAWLKKYLGEPTTPTAD
jgi:dipeptidyl aminopeptidase/acylaminoacyl peptidase